MRKSNLSKMVYIVLVFCAAAAISSPAQILTTIYNFCSQPKCADGDWPIGRLVQGNGGNFFGTTWAGGAAAGGTVFELTPRGGFTLLHTYSGSDGSQPYAGLTRGSDGNFYGVTNVGGGLSGCGATFEVTPGGAFTVLHDFGGGNNGDGCNPWQPMVQGSDGNFYGTTPAGGTGQYGGEGGGTVFKMTPAGAVTILYNFCSQGGSGCTDGAVPSAGVIQASDGNLYGTTDFGGAYGYGLVYKITTSGALTILHNFDFTDGYLAYGGVIQGSDGNFYGTTAGGGTYGTVFKMTPSGTLTTLYNFCSLQNCVDGHGPYAGVVQGSDGNFYGTTYFGGNTNNGGANGVVYVVTPSGQETVLYEFCIEANCADGTHPYAGVIQASDGNFYGVTQEGGTSTYHCSGGCGTFYRLQVSSTLTVTTSGSGTVTSTDGFINCPGTCSHVYPPNTPVTLNASPAQGWTLSGWTGACSGAGQCNIDMTGSLTATAVFVEPGHGIQLTTVTPCRLVDTRQSQPILGGTYESFTLPGLGGCGIPTSALAYSLNVTVVPRGPLGYLTIWPTGEGQAVVSTMNSYDGRIKANAAIVPAGANGAVSVYVTDTTDVILDIDGYFQGPGPGTYQFYPLTPCRVIDTRGPNGPLGGPYLLAQVERDFPVRESNCIPSGVNIAAYSMNFTVVPYPEGQPLGYLTVWPEGQTQPVVSTLNNPTATVVANAAIVPAATGGGIATYAYNTTNLIVDINGYFAPPGQGGYSLYTVAPCRAYDSRNNNGQPFQGVRTVNIVGSPCAPPSNATGYVFNATVVPSGQMPYLTLWPHSQQQPNVSTLNAYDGYVTSNMAIVPNIDGSIDAYAAGLTQVILDLSGYFAP